MGTNKFDGIKQLTYLDAKNEIRTGDLLFCDGHYMVSELIKKVSNSRFSHVGLMFHWNDRLLLFESVEDDGVRIVPLSHYLYNYENSGAKYNGTLYAGRHNGMASLTDQGGINNMLGKAADLLNRSYDKNEIARIVARIGLGVGRHTDNDEYTCSEFIEECYKQLKIIFSFENKGFIYPEHIAADPNVEALFEITP
ncbi:YiiX/YebB-like N1pC/P60 family cysteine hydrolase [Neobacillus terrae]|uniref:YiiX/YebB-like N1pC/P60 family cysteine hydrolase n=1 Tax=Neobacillus terrae TaxID=3034837 RepID=UPI00140A7C1E|nr:YiiX/YebB-like N1pC/P60 family cysteine hydrolase [Neobacillus terrae]NHM32534.1 hypothetical protein [Neobacillus terrae]